MKKMTGYYVPRSLADARDFEGQFKASRLSRRPVRMPIQVAAEAWQAVVQQRRSYPCDLRIFKDGAVVSRRLIQSCDDLSACSDWYWEHSEHMTLTARFTPV